MLGKTSVMPGTITEGQSFRSMRVPPNKPKPENLGNAAPVGDLPARASSRFFMPTACSGVIRPQPPVSLSTKRLTLREKLIANRALFSLPEVQKRSVAPWRNDSLMASPFFSYRECGAAGVSGIEPSGFRLAAESVLVGVFGFLLEDHLVTDGGAESEPAVD